VSDLLLTEEQQLETLKNFWREYGFSIISGMILAAVFGFGWRFYNAYIDQRAERAALIYQHFIIATTNHQTEEAKTQAQELAQNFKTTPYGDFGRLFLAKMAVEENKLEAASEQLSYVVKHSHGENMGEIARLRLARVYMAMHKAEAALAILGVRSLQKGVFFGAASELRGDIYAEQGDLSQAKKAYQAALLFLPAEAVSRPLLVMKLSELGVQ
jgi:predicted negative regulator of RcsB-dependent stress response